MSVAAVQLRRRVVPLQLRDGRRGRVSLAPDSTALALDDTEVSSFDLAGRPYALVRRGLTYRRALDGHLLEKGGVELRRVLTAREGAPVVEAARGDVAAAVEALDAATGPGAAEASRRLRRVLAMDSRALIADAGRFTATYRQVGVLPPDQYLAVLVQATEGCSWDACTFCDLFRGVPFRVKTPDELAWHISAVKEFFGEGLALRRRVFLGSANALCAAPERVVAMLTAVGRAFPVAPGGLGRREIGAWLRQRPGAVAGISAFVDAWTGRRHAAADYREFARLGLRRVYLGLETGDPALLAWLGKPGSPDDAVELAAAAHEAGVSVGVVVLTGAGGERFFDAHVAGTADVLSRMQLREDDLLYLSQLQPSARSAYRRRTTSPDLGALSAGRLLAQRSAIATAFRPADPARPPRVASYDLREFVY